MNKIAFKKKMTKGAFEEELFKRFEGEIEASPYDEENWDLGYKTFQRLTLYYNGENKRPNGGTYPRHIGTWTQGEGWIFNFKK